MKYGSRAWHFWQYQSDGRVPGIGGNVDKDAFHGTKEQWDAFLREPGVSPVQTGSPDSRPPLRPQQTAAAQPAGVLGRCAPDCPQIPAEAVVAIRAALLAGGPGRFWRDDR